MGEEVLHTAGSSLSTRPRAAAVGSSSNPRPKLGVERYGLQAVHLRLRALFFFFSTSALFHLLFLGLICPFHPPLSYFGS